jgi:hypothetical protein
MKSWVGTKYLAFNVPTLFWMLLKRSSACRERFILQKRFILWYMVKFSLQNDTSSKGYLLSAIRGQAGKLREELHPEAEKRSSICISLFDSWEKCTRSGKFFQFYILNKNIVLIGQFKVRVYIDTIRETLWRRDVQCYFHLWNIF